MKKVTVGFKEENYGYVEVEVEDNATEDEIIDAAYEAENDGMCNWYGKREITCTGIIDAEEIHD